MDDFAQLVIHPKIVNVSTAIRSCLGSRSLPRKSRAMSFSINAEEFAVVRINQDVMKSVLEIKRRNRVFGVNLFAHRIDAIKMP